LKLSSILSKGYYSRNKETEYIQYIDSIYVDDMTITDFIAKLNNLYINNEYKTIEFILSKYDLKIINNKTVLIDGMNYNFIHNINKVLLLFFNLQPGKYVVLKNDNIIYIFTTAFKLKIILNGTNILNIYYNDYVLIDNYNDLPFYHYIPKNIFYIIYKQDDLYKVTYFNNYKLISEENILPNLKEDSIFLETITINPNNLCFPILQDTKIFINFIN